MTTEGTKIKVNLGDELNGTPSDERDADFSKLDQENDAAESAEYNADQTADRAGAEAANARIAELEREVADTKDKYLRAMADFENYKKRAIKERSEMLKYQGDKILADLLAVVDSIELAVTHKDADPAQVKAGIELIHKLFLDTLGKWDVRPISGIGSQFDPTRFEAISKIQDPSSKPGTIIGEARKGYLYKDKLLRPGEVIVAVEPAPGDDAPPKGEETLQ